jgi:hypothetical protein
VRLPGRPGQLIISSFLDWGQALPGWRRLGTQAPAYTGIGEVHQLLPVPFPLLQTRV